MLNSSTSHSNAINEESKQYPYPCHVNAASFISIKLSSKKNYVGWEEQIWCLIESHDMVGFIDGTSDEPQEYDGSKMKADMTAFEAKFKAWKMSDSLVKGWIFGSLSEDVMLSVVGLQTASDVWNKLKVKFGTPPGTVPINVSNITPTTKEKDMGEYFPLCTAIQLGDWKKAKKFFEDHNDALTAELNSAGDRALHVAIGNPENSKFFDDLLELIDAESLPYLVDTLNQNALHYAAKFGDTIAAKKLVKKNPYLLFIVDIRDYLPIHTAAINSRKATFPWLLQVCKEHIALSQNKGCYNPFEGEKGAMLLSHTILGGFLDEAYALLTEHPELAKVDYFESPPLWCIAQKRDAYRSAKTYNFYQRFVYSHVETNYTYMRPDIENQGICSANLVYTVFKWIYVKFWKYAQLHVPHIKHLHEEKKTHNTALNILKLICGNLAELKSYHSALYGEALISAINNNTPEVVAHIIEVFPQSVWASNKNDHSISQLSIIQRCEDVYNFFVHEVTHDKYLHNIVVDKKDNTLLHLAAKLAPPHKLNMVTGAALQMQRELQWFQEVGKLVRAEDWRAKNDEGKTPIIVFREEHKDLRKEGEEWIKKTADSYTITAALIITTVFAAAITVPGGNNGETGRAIYETRASFIIFIVSDAVSLFTSTTSLLLFLSILTARYAEEDFLYKLPKRLIFGLVMLFMSVTTMLIAFSASLFIMFGQEKHWIMAPIIAMACLPVASFVTLQLPLLYDLVYSTYGHGIFGKQRELRITS